MIDTDHIAAHYFAGLDLLTSIKAIDLRMIHAERCSHCAGGPATRLVGRYVRSRLEPGRTLAEWHEVCATCRRAWEPEPWGDRCVLRGEISSRCRVRGNRVSNVPSARPGHAEESILRVIARWRYARALVEPRPLGWSRAEWVEALRLWEGYLHPAGGSIANVAAASGRSKTRAHEILTAARAIVAKRARRPEARRAA